MTPRTLLLGAGSLSLMGLLGSADLVRDSYDLTLKFSEGQKIRTENETTFVIGLDDAAASFGGQELPADVTLDVEMIMTQVIDDEISEVRDGSPSKMRRTFDTLSMSVSGEAGAMGQIESIDESEDMPLEGRTVEISVSEDGDVEVNDVTEGEDPLDEDMLGMMNGSQNMGDVFLPKSSVEVGDSWDIAEATQEVFDKLMGSNPGGAEMAEIMDGMKGIMEQAEVEAVGRLVSVDGDSANIEWKMSFELTIDDIFEMARDFMDPEITENLPQDADGMFEVVLEAEGVGVFDLSLGQLVSMDMEGEYSMAMEMAMSQDGMEMDGSAEMSGSMEMATVITVE